MKRVLVTGASGFIGRHCPPLLESEGYQVHAVSSSPILPGRSTIGTWHCADLLDSGQVVNLLTKLQPTHLLHLAWDTTHGKYWSTTENFRWVSASLNLVKAFAECGGQRAVIAGSCAEYDWHSSLCSELTTPLAPATLYGACKHALQIMFTAYARQVNLSAAWGRLFFLYGPFEHPQRLVASVIRSLLANEPARCTHGNQQRDFLHVEDAAAAMVALLNSDVRGPVNIASGQPVALKQIIYQMADHLNCRGLVQLEALASPPDEPALLYADVQRLQREVGWTPRYDLNRGLESAINWWKRQLSANESQE